MGGGLALRLAVERGTDGLRREAQLAALFPAEVGYPQVLETGETSGYEWSLSKEIPGRNLGEIWPTLDWDQRLLALRQLWKKVEAVHRVNVAAAAPLARKRSLFYAAHPQEARDGLAHLMNHKVVSARQADVLEKALDRFWQALNPATLVLNHGDFTTENALWQEGQVVALMDFEFAVIAPDELDLNELVKSAFAPKDTIDPLPDPGRQGLERMRRLVMELAMPMLAHPGSRDLLMGYAILLEIWNQEDRLVYPPTDNGLDQQTDQQAITQILGSLADGQGGYLAPILAMIE